MLLYGAPGTGKTLLARAIAGEAKVPIIHIVASKFSMGDEDMLVGVQAAKLRGMFAYAKLRVSAPSQTRV
jgi:ATP-dependent Zn protease